MGFLFFILLLMTSTISIAQESIDLSMLLNKPFINITNQGEIAKTDKFTDLLPEEKTFERIKENALQLPYSGGKYWFKYKFKNLSTKEIESILYFDTSQTGFLDLYQKDSLTQRWKLISLDGNSRKKREGKTDGLFGGFKIKINATNEMEFIIGRQSRHPLSAKVMISSPEYYQKESNERFSILLIYIGAIASLFIYHFFIYILLRRKEYGLYCLFSISLAVAILSIYGFLDFTIKSTTLNFNYNTILFSIASLITFALYTNHYLSIKTFAPKIDLLFKLSNWSA